MTSDEIDPKPFDQFEAESAASMEHWIEKLGLEGDAAERYRDHGKHWILIDGEPVAVPLLEWGRWFENTPQRIIGQDDIIGPDGSTYWVSTVFLGMDHSFGHGPMPLLFETMIFKRHEPRTEMLLGREYTSDKESLDWQMRAATLRQAQLQHESAIRAVRSGEVRLYEEQEDA